MAEDLTLNLKERIHFYYEVYRDELQRRDSLDGSLQLPGFFFSLVAAGVGFFGNMLLADEPHAGTNTVGFLLSLTAGFISTIIAGWYFHKAFWGVDYAGVPRPSLMESYFSADGEPGQDYSKHLLLKISEAVDCNREANDTRAEARRRMRIPIVVGFFTLVFCALIVWIPKIRLS